MATGPTFDSKAVIGSLGIAKPVLPAFDPNKPVPIRPSTAELSRTGDLINGLYGGSRKQTGVVGESETGTGIAGSGPKVGVFGDSETGDGVVGTGRRGVVGESRSFQGVFGRSVENAGVVGESDRLHGVFGMCHNPNGGAVFGTNDAGGFGVIGLSESGIGVFGKGSVLAARFEGDVEVTGDIRLANADCAEHFELAGGQRVDPGTVMVLGDQGALRESDQPYDKRVAGVISGAGDYEPALVLDQRADSSSRQPLALLGKVFCKVDARYARVEVGDLLTTSATAGHAMKATDSARAFGTVIGKALRPLAAGQGLIPILVALQ